MDGLIVLKPPEGRDEDQCDENDYGVQELFVGKVIALVACQDAFHDDDGRRQREKGRWASPSGRGVMRLVLRMEVGVWGKRRGKVGGASHPDWRDHVGCTAHWPYLPDDNLDNNNSKAK
jgi:hypothetical protein